MTRDRAIAWLLGLLIGVVAGAVYAPVFDFPFVAWRDDVFLQQNAAVRTGLSADSLGWAFTSAWGGSYAPLAWASHLLDFTLFGSDAGGHHATSVFLHALNAILLFGALRSASGALLQPAAVALLLVVHPIHVESVAWISERGGLVCATFGFASLWCYVVHSLRGNPVARRFALLFLALSLLAKPLLVTLPILYLLIDHWPLRRAPAAESAPGGSPLAGLAAGKWPYLLIAAIAAGVALAVYGRAEIAAEPVPSFFASAANAIVAEALYLWKLAWPAKLAALYPQPAGGWGALAIGGALAALAIIAAIAVRLRRPPLTVGLLWYAIALLPVLGIVPIGPQALADRFAYVPAVGIYLAVAFGGGELLARRPRGVQAAGVALFCALLVPLALVTRAQIATWRSSEALFRHATEVTRDNAAMQLRLAGTLEGRGRLEEAIDHYRKAIEIDPELGEAHFRLANALLAANQLEAARAQYQEALRLRVEYANDMIGLLLVASGDTKAAIAHYREQVRRQPESADAHALLAHALSAAGELPEALAEYRAAAGLASDPARWSAEIEALEGRIRDKPAP